MLALVSAVREPTGKRFRLRVTDCSRVIFSRSFRLQTAAARFSASALEMLQWVLLLLSSCCLLHGVSSSTEGAASVAPLPTFGPDQESGESDLEDLETGSGSPLLPLFHNIPAADSPFTTETPEKTVNCSRSFWLPPSQPVCGGDDANPEEFAKSRLMVLQNRAALRAVSTLSGVEASGNSYNHQAREEVQGIQVDHTNVVETIGTIESVFISLKEKRKEGKEQAILTRMKEHLSRTSEAIDGREQTANHLERSFLTLEKTLLNLKLRISKLIPK